MQREGDRPIVNGQILSGKHPYYSVWAMMRQRCSNPNCKQFKAYGGRGITIQENWLETTSVFSDLSPGFIRYALYIETYLGPKPSPYHSIDRINNDGNYEEGNLRWATQKEQNENRRERSIGVSGIGVSGFRWVARQKNKWLGNFTNDKQRIYCGYYATPEEAYKAVIQKRIEMNLPIPD